MLEDLQLLRVVKAYGSVELGLVNDRVGMWMGHVLHWVHLEEGSFRSDKGMREEVELVRIWCVEVDSGAFSENCGYWVLRIRLSLGRPGLYVVIRELELGSCVGWGDLEACG